jgi:hypothetical protein
VSAAPGYALRLDEDAVDSWRFETLVRRARAERDTGRAGGLLKEALDLWQGPAFAEFADQPWAAAETARLAEVRLGARERSIGLLLRGGELAEAVPQAEVLTGEHPLREEGWRLLALGLWAGGRQADALAALRRVRGLLAEELGLDPGPALTELEDSILRGQVKLAQDVATAAPVAVSRTPTVETFVGRELELALVAEAANHAKTGAIQIMLVSGEPGIGKSTLLAQVEAALAVDGWLVAVGRCPEAEGAPPAWAWVQIIRSLAAWVSLSGFEDRLAPLLSEDTGPADADAANGRFRLHQAVCTWLTRTGRPLALILDDLHAADEETLALLSTVAEVDGPVLLVAAFRPAELDERFTEILAALARRSPVRVALTGLDRTGVARLVGAICGPGVDEATVTAVAERTGGNPFYVRESARLLASEGALVAVSEVPEGVRDVLRRRLARLPDPAVAVLRLAAVAGQEVEVDVIVEAADASEAGVLDALEAGLIAGLLTEPSPGRVRFTHALARDTLYQDLTRPSTSLKPSRWRGTGAHRTGRKRL